MSDPVFKFTLTPGLLLDTDSPKFTILDANLAYLEMVCSPLEKLKGTGLFEAFPALADKKNKPALGSRSLISSFDKVLKTGKTDVMDICRYDLFGSSSQKVHEKYRELVNIPILENGKVTGILHSVKDVTETVLSEKYEWFAKKELLATERKFKKKEAVFTKENRQILLNLKERVKEINCLYEISHLGHETATVDELLERATEILPGGFKYPELINLKIKYDDRSYHKRTFKPHKWSVSAENIVYTGNKLEIEICYPEDVSESGRDPFLKEEKQLVSSLAENLGLIINQIESLRSLAKSRGKLQKIMDQSQDLICTISRKGKFIDVSKASETLLGYAENEMIGKSFRELVYEEDQKITMAIFDQIMSGRPVTNFENRYVHKSGKIVPVVWSARWDSNEDIIYAAGRDASEKRKAEKEIRERKEFIEVTFDNLPIGIAVHTMDHGRSTLMNKKFSEIYGWPREEIDNVDVFFEKVYPDEEYRKKIASEVLDGISSGDPEKMHWEGVRITRKDGEQRYVNAKNIPLPGQNLMISTVMDVTRKKKDEELILYKSSLLAAIAKADSILLRYDDWFATIHETFEIIGEAVQADRVYYFENYEDPETGQHFTNQKVEWSRDDIEPQINNPVWQNVPFEAFDRFLDPLTEQETFQSLTKDLTEGDFKIEIQNQDILSLLVIPIFVQEKFWGFIGFDDCTDERTWTDEEVSFLKTITGNLANAIGKYQSGQTLKKLNKELEVRARELAVSNAELEEFAFVVSHDLQEPLRMVRSFMNLLERRYEDKLDDRAKKYIRFAANGAKRMQQIILDLLEFSRVGHTDTEMSDVDIDALLHSSVQFCRRIIKEKSADVSWGKMPVITAAKNPLQQVFQNLLNNALIYQPKEHKPRVVIRAHETDTHWQFEIEDNGIGIHEDDIETIFNIFHRFHTDDTFEGTGIGLAICKKIIELHGGKIWVESAPGKGSIFYFTIIK